ncbi:MAG: GyrI-like domain-containing protein [Thermoplasmata archaeon]|nr:GyrI-like domain-containing protein [Thermoplasmata archaeon]
MEKLDFKKELKHLYNPSKKEIVTVDVPEMNFLMIDGKGDPNTAKEYQDAMEALYSVAYTLKFMLKGEGKADFVVMPLEGLWWVPNMEFFDAEDKDSWFWTAMMMQPDLVTKKDFERAAKQAGQKRDLPSLPKIRLGKYEEGLSAQIMYIGPFADEGPTIESIHKYIEESGHKLRGKHHEIYLSDPRRTKPERLKTVIRQPME